MSAQAIAELRARVLEQLRRQPLTTDELGAVLDVPGFRVGGELLALERENAARRVGVGRGEWTLTAYGLSLAWECRQTKLI